MPDLTATLYPPLPSTNLHLLLSPTTTTLQVSSARREFPIYDLENNVKYEFIPALALQYKDFIWQARCDIDVDVVCFLLVYIYAYCCLGVKYQVDRS